MRRLAWSALRNAAEAGRPRAIEMMISLLRKGRFIEQVRLGTSPQKAAYFWILRSRRLRMPPTLDHAEVERMIIDSDREEVRKREEFEWQLQQPLVSSPPSP
jgi:hypothetical protein